MKPTEPELDAILAEAGITITRERIDMPAESLDRLATLVWLARHGECAGFARKPKMTVAK